MAYPETPVTVRLYLSNPGWLDTGIVIAQGDRVRIDAVGVGDGGGLASVDYCYPEGSYWNASTGTNDYPGHYDASKVNLYPVGASSNGAAACYPAPTFCLMTAIFPGVSPPSSTGNSYANGIYIGRGRELTVDEMGSGGRLWFCFNDGWGGHFDNSGYFDVTIESVCSHSQGRDISTELEAEFIKETGRYTFLLAIEPVGQDGEGYTSFDQDLSLPAVLDEKLVNVMVPALTYFSENNVLPTEVPEKTGGSDDTVDIMTAIVESNRVKWENEYYDNATVTLMACKWDDTSVAPVILMSGKIGKGTLGDISGKFELRPWTHLLQRNILRVVSPICDCPLFGRGRCAGNGEDPDAPQIADRTFAGTISSVIDRDNFTVSGIGQGDGWADFGRIYFTGSAENTGAKPRSIKKWMSGGIITLHTSFPHLISVGDTVMVEEGCKRSWEACQAKDNTNNFQGFPHLPGRQGVVKRYQT